MIVSAEANSTAPGEFEVPVPWLHRLQGAWECALVDIALNCEGDRLYLCSDIVNQSYVAPFADPILRIVHTNGKSSVSQSFLDPRYVQLRTGWRQYARFRCLNDLGQPVQTTHLYAILHVRPRQ